MKCNEFNEIIQDYVEGLLEASRRKSFKEHVEDCGDCSGKLAEFERVFNLLGKLERDDPPPDLACNVMEELHSLSLVKKRDSAGVLRIPSWIPSRLRVAGTTFLMVLLALFSIVKLWQGTREVLGRAVIWTADGVIGLRDSLGDFGFLYRLFEVLLKDLKMIGALIDTVLSLIWSSGEGYIIPCFLALVLVMFLVAFLFRSIGKRRPHDAPFCI